jgi:hypothetical protein
MPKLLFTFDISRKPLSSYTNKRMNPNTILSSAVSISEEITISAIEAFSDLSDTIEEKKKFKNTA